jgi:ERCC4-related helicase
LSSYNFLSPTKPLFHSHEKIITITWHIVFYEYQAQVQIQGNVIASDTRRNHWRQSVFGRIRRGTLSQSAW